MPRIVITQHGVRNNALAVAAPRSSSGQRGRDRRAPIAPFRAILGTSHVAVASERWAYEWVEGIKSNSTKLTIPKSSGRSSKDPVTGQEDEERRATNLFEETSPDDHENIDCSEEDAPDGFVDAVGALVRKPLPSGTVVIMHADADDDGTRSFYFHAVNPACPYCPEPEPE